jgi:hypothetical protein
VLGGDAAGNSLRFASHVEEIPSSEGEVRTFRQYYLFDETLPKDCPHQPLTIGYTAKLGDPYPRLGNSPEVVSFFGRNVAEEMIVGVAFPKSLFVKSAQVVDAASISTQDLMKFGLSLDPDEKVIASNQIPVHDLIDSMRLAEPPEKYFIAGRRATNLNRGEGFGFVIS